MPAFDGIYELRFTYVVPITGQPTLSHRHTVDVKLAEDPVVGEDFTTIVALSRLGVEVDLDGAVLNYLNFIKAFYATNVDFPIVELWRYPTEGTNATYVSSLELGESGTGASPTSAAWQTTITLRSQGGSIMRVQLMETTTTNNNVESFPTSNVGVNNFAGYLTGGTSPFVARDDTFPLVPLKWSSGQNEKLFRKRFRAT